MGLGLTARQLEYMRAQALQLMPGTCVISAPTRVSDGAGGGTVTYTAVAGGTVACRIDPFNSRTNRETFAEREGLVNRYQLTIPHSAPMAPDYRVEAEGVVYEIREYHANNAWPVTKRAELAKVE